MRMRLSFPQTAREAIDGDGFASPVSGGARKGEQTDGSRDEDGKSKSPPCRKKRDKDGPPSGVEISEGVGQPPAIGLEYYCKPERRRR